MAKRGDKKYLDDSIAFFMGWNRQATDMLYEYKDKLTPSQAKNFGDMEKEIYESVAVGNVERARERTKEEEEIKLQYKGTAANRLQSLEMSLNIRQGERLVEAGNKFKKLCEEITAAVGAKTTPVSETVRKMTRQRMKKLI